MTDQQETIINDAVCNLHGCKASCDAIIGAVLGDSYEMNKETLVSALMLLNKNIQDATQQIQSQY